MSLDPRTPVIVGVAQSKQRPDDLSQAVEAISLMEQVVRNASADAGATSLLSDLDLIGVVRGAWKYSDPGRLLAERVGAENARTSLSADGGNTPQSFVNSVAARIARGELQSAVICGAETIWSRRRQRRAEMQVPFTRQDDVEPDERFGADVPMQNNFESARGVEMPIHFYPLFESAIRHANGESVQGHRDRIAELWHRFNQVAVGNEYAWSRSPMTAAEIREPSDSNRMVGFPYTKAMNSNWDLDQAAAVLICSVQAAEQAGVPPEKWVFPWAGTDAHDTYSVSNRRDLHSSPAITQAAATLFEMTGTTPADVDHVDLYSCFPSAVQVGAKSIGLDMDRQLTQTGGLTFAGGPLNNYVTHSIAAMVETLRNDPGSIGLVTANGGFLTKHALALYSTEPPAELFRAVDVQKDVDRIEPTELDQDYTGTVAIEAYTIMHDGNGGRVGLCAVHTPHAARSWGCVTDSAAIESMLTSEAIGRSAHLDADGTLTLT